MDKVVTYNPKTIHDGDPGQTAISHKKNESHYYFA
jgi:hypothetical protein